MEWIPAKLYSRPRLFLTLTPRFLEMYEQINTAQKPWAQTKLCQLNIYSGLDLQQPTAWSSTSRIPGLCALTSDSLLWESYLGNKDRSAVSWVERGADHNQPFRSSHLIVSKPKAYTGTFINIRPFIIHSCPLGVSTGARCTCIHDSNDYCDMVLGSIIAWLGPLSRNCPGLIFADTRAYGFLSGDLPARKVQHKSPFPLSHIKAHRGHNNNKQWILHRTLRNNTV